ERIDQVVDSEDGLKLKRIKCAAMEGLIEEANEVIESTDKNEVRDAALIAAAQKVEHYEIASYGTLVTLAEQLGYKKAAKLLKETLEEEKATDVKLTDLAFNNVNKKAQDNS
ncbi:TPA: ferritin-like domain-containing protein, partial [Escherichia coli]|nr:ferritin-like domain-containing protein [Escherichia coli]